MNHAFAVFALLCLCVTGTFWSADDVWDLFEHLGGDGPFVRLRRHAHPPALPPDCRVANVQGLFRHAERFPTLTAGHRHKAMLQRLRGAAKLRRPLGFINDYEYFAEEADLEGLTTEGPYAGTRNALRTGKSFAQSYAQLVDSTSILATDSPRVYDSARYFAAGYGASKVVVVNESEEACEVTLTPPKRCQRYRTDPIHGHDYGHQQLLRFSSTYLPRIAERLHEASGWKFLSSEIYGMQELCAFETNARGASSFCGLFTHDEWEDFEYARDLKHTYRSGYGNPYGAVMGAPLLRRVHTRLQSRESSFSFMHDGDLVPLIVALGLFEDEELLPTSRKVVSRKWRSTRLVPMNARIVFERVECKQSVFIRVIINEGLVMEVPSAQFSALVDARIGGLNFTQTCMYADR